MDPAQLHFIIHCSVFPLFLMMANLDSRNTLHTTVLDLHVVLGQIISILLTLKMFNLLARGSWQTGMKVLKTVI